MMSSGVTSEAIKQHHKLVLEIKEQADVATRLIQAINDKVTNWTDCGYDSADGLSFLELKNLLMLEYLGDLSFVMLKKSAGKSISGDAAVERIVENRTVLEKMRPLEKKLKYQIDKYIKIAESGEINKDDPLHFKPNISAMEESEDEEDQQDGENGDVGKESKYVVPKHVPTICRDDMTQEEIEKEEGEKQRKKTLSKAIVEDLKRQYMDAPEEDFNHSDTLKTKHIAEMKERQRYEEEHYVRLPDLSKKEKHKRRKSMTTMGSLGDELTYFGGNNFFNDSSSGIKKRGKRSSLQRFCT